MPSPTSPRKESCDVFLQRQRMRDRGEQFLAWVLLLVLRGHSLRALLVLQLRAMIHLMPHPTQPHGAPWIDSIGARGSRSLQLPLGRPFRAPQGGRITHRSTGARHFNDRQKQPPHRNLSSAREEVKCVSGGIWAQKHKQTMHKSTNILFLTLQKVTKFVFHRLGRRGTALASVHSAYAPAP